MSALLQFVISSLWAVDEMVFTRGIEVIQRHAAGEKLPAADVGKVAQERDQNQKNKGRPVDSRAYENGYELSGSVAVVPVEGVIARHASMVNGMSSPRGTTTDALVEAVRKAEADPKVRAMLLDFDSPGGAVEGLHDVIAEVRRVRDRMPVVALARDKMLSAAYWLGSQADELHVTPAAEVGSIGVFGLIDDTSALLAKTEVKRFLVRSGRYKGIGQPGLPVSDEDLGALQARVDATHRVFVADVAAGRRVPEKRAAELSDGRAFVGRDAVTLGLADQVAGGGIQSVVDGMNKRFGVGSGAPLGPMTARRREILAMTPEEMRKAHPDVVATIEKQAADKALEGSRPQPATIQQLKAEFPGDNRAGFRESCLEKNVTIDQARGAFATVVATERDQAAARAEKAEKEAADLRKLGTAGDAGDPVTAGGDAGAAGDGPKNFMAAVAGIERELKAADPAIKAGDAKGQAMMAAARKHPKLHQEWLLTQVKAA